MIYVEVLLWLMVAANAARAVRGMPIQPNKDVARCAGFFMTILFALAAFEVHGR